MGGVLLTALLLVAFLSNPVHLLRDGTAHSGLGPTPTINNQENPLCHAHETTG